MISATSPNQDGVAGTDSRSGLDDHRRISDTGHIYLLVGNNFVLPHQGGIFLSEFATAYISLRNSWELKAQVCQDLQVFWLRGIEPLEGVVSKGAGLIKVSSLGLQQEGVL